MQSAAAEFERSDEDVPVYLNALLLSTEPGPIGDRGRQLIVALRSRLSAVIEQLVLDGAIAEWVDPDAMARPSLGRLDRRTDPAMSRASAELQDLIQTCLEDGVDD